jgi:ParB family chromosome partitioning protein
MAKTLGKGSSRHGRETSISHIKDLVADPENRRKHNPRNLGMVVDALHQVGAARSIVIDEDNVILAGNGVTEAAAEAGITNVQVVEVDGTTLVAVRRRGLTVEQKRALAIYDNRTADLAEWNAEQLQADAIAGLPLHPWFTDEEAAKLLASQNVPDFAPVGEDEQGRLDQKKPVTCPSCGHDFQA